MVNLCEGLLPGNSNGPFADVVHIHSDGGRRNFFREKRNRAPLEMSPAFGLNSSHVSTSGSDPYFKGWKLEFNGEQGH